MKASQPNRPDNTGDDIRALERVTINLIPRAAIALGTGMKLTGHSKTDFINRAVQAYAFLEEQLKEGHDLIIRNNATGETQAIWFL